MTELDMTRLPHAALPDATGPRDRASVRRTNLGAVLGLLRDSGPRSRAQIAIDTGLPKPTVTSLVAELVALRLVREGPARREGAVGRPGTLVELDGGAICGVGVEISTGYVHILALALDGTEVHEDRISLAVRDEGPDATLDLTSVHLADCLAALDREGRRPVGLTLALPGVIDIASATVTYAPGIGWRDVAVADALRTRLERAVPGTLPPIAVDNDAKLAALAEYAQVRGSGVHDMLCITGERGIGAGIVNDGRLLRGAAGFAGEVGHMPLDPHRNPCVCGRYGCWQTMVGLDAILRLAAPGNDPVHDPDVELAIRLGDVRRRAEAGDPRTISALDRVAHDLGLGLALLADVLNPRLVILGGYFTHIGDLFLDTVRESVRARVMAPQAGGCEVRLSTLGFTAAARGGAQLALDAVYRRPALLS
ncbi:ROK family transcriptional regulator [Streptomyces sp. M41(2017)]|uniref:ROK family transcriptional regulator n=1 Tax=Streptomyces sp. M41(2017) TaxID=1955065 RepID=UPI0019D4ADC5|nr:ROK family transcriptional regulator [Streptomyces sp. M41(2017)]